MKKEQRKAAKPREKSVSVKKRPEEKKPQKQLITGHTEIMDFDLEEEIETGKSGADAVKSSKKRAVDREEKKEPKKSKTAAKDESFLDFVPKKMSSDRTKTPRVHKASGEKAMSQKASEAKAASAAKAARKEEQPKKKAAAKAAPAVKAVPKEEQPKKTPADKAAPKEEQPRKAAPAVKVAPKEELPKKKVSAAGESRGKAAPEKKKRKSSGSDFGAMDVVIALMGILVVVVGITTVGIYRNARTIEEQVAAMAEVGEQMETIGIAGESVLMAVADNRMAGMEAAGQETESMEETSIEPVTYEEKELTTEVKVVLKLTSVQRDLKIKFTNKESGKLIGNQAFTVKIAGPETLTKTDDDKDGIIYIKSITPGDYTVTVTGPESIDGNPVSGVKGNVTVKDKIEYKKIDVADEVKKESEINVAKEDTAVVNQVESALTDTVEWVESTKTPLDGEGSDYEEVKKEDIPEPSSVAVLDMIWAADSQNGSYLARDFVQSADAGAFGVYFTQETVREEAAQTESPQTESPQTESAAESKPEVQSSVPEESSSAAETKTEQESSAAEPSSEAKTETESTPPAESVAAPETQQPSVPPELKVTKVSIAGGGDYTVGDTVTLTAQVETSGEGSLSDGDYVWSGDVSGTGKSLNVPSGEARNFSVTLTVKGVAATAAVNVKKKAAETEPAQPEFGVSLEDPGSMKVGEEKQLSCKVTGEEESRRWTVSDSMIAAIEETGGKVLGISAGKVTVTVTVKGKNGQEVSDSKELTVSGADVEGITTDPSGMKLRVGENGTIRASVTTSGNRAVKWKSEDESIVKILESYDDNCKVQAVKAGSTKITAISKENEDRRASCEVTVEASDGSAPLKDKDGNQLYYKEQGEYKAATAADYYKYDVFYRKKNVSGYKYTGWQNIDGKRYYYDKNGNYVTGEQTIQGMKYSFHSDGSLQVNGIMGIDVSKHNGSIDWNAVKNSGVNYVIIRCGYRGSATGVLVEDERFRSNIKGAAAAGLKVGVYFFSQAVNEVEAVEEASLALDLIRPYSLSYPVFMDVESANGRADGLDAGTRTKIIQAFCEVIRRGGYTPGVYANRTWLTSKMNVGALGGYKIWLAQYAATPTYSGRYEMWQYSSKGKIAGISGDVDLNISYLSY